MLPPAATGLLILSLLDCASGQAQAIEGVEKPHATKAFARVICPSAFAPSFLLDNRRVYPHISDVGVRSDRNAAPQCCARCLVHPAYSRFRR
jgi:hypothetical protein